MKHSKSLARKNGLVLAFLAQIFAVGAFAHPPENDPNATEFVYVAGGTYSGLSDPSGYVTYGYYDINGNRTWKTQGLSNNSNCAGYNGLSEGDCKAISGFLRDTSAACSNAIWQIVQSINFVRRDATYKKLVQNPSSRFNFSIELVNPRACDLRVSLDGTADLSSLKGASGVISESFSLSDLSIDSRGLDDIGSKLSGLASKVTSDVFGDVSASGGSSSNVGESDSAYKEASNHDAGLLPAN